MSNLAWLIYAANVTAALQALLLSVMIVTGGIITVAVIVAVVDASNYAAKTSRLFGFLFMFSAIVFVFLPNPEVFEILMESAR